MTRIEDGNVIDEWFGLPGLGFLFWNALACYSMANDNTSPNNRSTLNKTDNMFFWSFENRSPFNNPTETYRFYSLPFCHEHSTVEEESDAAIEEEVEVHKFQGNKQLGAQRHRQRLGESIVGDRRESSPYEISYQDSVDWRMLCKKHMLPKDIAKLKDAIHNNYFFEMFVEDLPMWGYIGDIEDEDMLVGETEGSKTFLFTHLNFIVGYNNNQIVSAKVTTDVS